MCKRNWRETKKTGNEKKNGKTGAISSKSQQAMGVFYPAREAFEYGRTIVESVIDHRVGCHEGAISNDLVHVKSRELKAGELKAGEIASRCNSRTRM